ncbi:NAD(P)H-dependent flavin oxidoreductase [Rhodococcus sp. C26F]
MPESRLPVHLSARLRVPAVAAPMLGVSGPELVSAACRAGVVGSFPTANARTATELDDWIATIENAIGSDDAPYAPNLIMRSPRFADDLAVLVQRRCEVVITSVGSPAAAVDPLHDIGALVLADVATLGHAQRAVAAGADGLVLLTAGAGGQTGWMNPFAFVRAVRSFFDGPIVLAGGICDGESLFAARVLGCDLGYLGTSFLATEESRAALAHKQMVADSTLDDIVLTRAFTGLPASMLRDSIEAAGLDPSTLDETVTPESATKLFGSGAEGPRRWSQIWSAGHSVSGVDRIMTTENLVSQLAAEYAGAARRTYGGATVH